MSARPQILTGPFEEAVIVVWLEIDPLAARTEKPIYVGRATDDRMGLLPDHFSDVCSAGKGLKELALSLAIPADGLLILPPGATLG